MATHAKSFENNPVLGSARLNALGLHVQRRQLAMAMAGYRRNALASRLDAGERAHFEQNGFFIRENALPAEQFAALRAELGALRSTGWEMRQGRAVTRRVSLDQDVLAQNPASAAFVADRGVRDLIAYASSNTGGITYQLQSIVIDAANADQDPQTRLHADTFHPTAKAWLFLDDVADDQGPFSYVPGSHRLTPERLAWEYRQSLGLRAPASRCTVRVRSVSTSPSWRPLVCRRPVALRCQPTPWWWRIPLVSMPAARAIRPATASRFMPACGVTRSSPGAGRTCLHCHGSPTTTCVGISG
ncbi:phytanoyl-CoA dioxygenase family protein [Pseudomonas sp. Ap32]|nr:phytanoyl-CoA dioxygenase family protein [Pseudomonas sp. Ap32]